MTDCKFVLLWLQEHKKFKQSKLEEHKKWEEKVLKQQSSGPTFTSVDDSFLSQFAQD